MTIEETFKALTEQLIRIGNSLERIGNLMEDISTVEPVLPEQEPNENVDRRYYVRVLDRANAFEKRSENRKGFPIMKIISDDKGRHTQWRSPTRLVVKPDIVRADGEKYFFELVEFKDMYVRQQDVEAEWISHPV